MVSPDGAWVATGCSDTVVRLYMLDRQSRRAIRYSGHTAEVTHIQVTDNLQHSPQPLHSQHSKHSKYPQQPQHHSQQLLSSITDNRLLMLWFNFIHAKNWCRFPLFWMLHSVDESFRSSCVFAHMQVSHDGEVLATGSTDGTARLWYCPLPPFVPGSRYGWRSVPQS